MTEGDIRRFRRGSTAFDQHRTLILGPDYRPWTFPLPVWGPENTITAMCLGRVKPLIWSDVYAHSPSMSLRLPHVVVLKEPVDATLLFGAPNCSANNLFLRDRGRCQYTGVPLFFKSDDAETEATLDHVLPRAQGGASDWQNLVLASKEVNNWKGNRKPREAGLRLQRKPWIPTGYDLLCLQVRDRSGLFPVEWHEFLRLKPSKKVEQICEMEPAV